MERFSQRFEREALAVAALNHPNICTLHDAARLLIMELVKGKPLKGRFSADDALRYAAQICGEALDHAHRKGVHTSQSKARRHSRDEAGCRTA